MSSNRQAYWRSLEQLADSPEYREFLHREFPLAASELPEAAALKGSGREGGAVGDFSRRRWIQLMGASMALGGMAGCRWQADEILPFVDRPEDRVPGMPQQFATAWELGGVGRPLVAHVTDGRPTKIEGNPQHPLTRGGTDVFDQAFLLGMYDPDRIDAVVESGQQRTWQEAEAGLDAIRDQHSGDGAGLRVLAEPSSSLVVASLRERFAETFPNARFVEYSPAGDSAEREGLRAGGGSLRPVYDFSKADVVVSFDADVLGCHPGSAGYIRDWASRRAPEDGAMNRTYVVESEFSGTGASADHRVAVRSSDVGAVVREVAGAIGGEGDEGGAAANGDDSRSRVIAAMVEDLRAAEGRSVVCCGAHQPAAVHAAVARLNETLGNVGETVRYIETADRPDDFAALRELAEEMRGGRVETLILLGGNPLYDAPIDLDFGAAMASCDRVVRLSMYDDETGLAALSGDRGWLLPQTHPVEQWDVLRAYDGSVLSQQPLMPVVLNGRSVNEVLGRLVGDERTARQMHAEALAEAGVEETGIDAVLERGFVEGSQAEEAGASFGGRADADATGDGGDWEGIEVVVRVSPVVYDGRFANNGWLQETPQPLTKVVWDNTAIMSPATAKRLGVTQEDLVTIAAGGGSVELPVFLMPGHADESITVHLGYGRKAAGRVGSGSENASNWSLVQERLPDGPVGVDVTPLRTSDAPYILAAEVSAAGGSYDLSTTQDHFAIDTMGLEGIAGRVDDLVREGTLEQYEEHPDFAQHQVHLPPLESLWDEWDYEKRAWGMSIDLAKCVGCNACVTACTSENNIPVVGKGQVGRGREMHWIRLDRYFAGDPDDPQAVRAVHQPVACHHCENAPCEQVCPVAATVHSAEGLNDMVYNRCIGTRYCANNCPYKVRRFNFFNYNKVYDYEGEPGAGSDGQGGYDLQAMILNPEVTVRSRGVMEKCTYCVQRIKGVTLYAKNERRKVKDGEIVTACQAACPADAIVFGDLHDKDSRVLAEQSKPRAYAMLAELNVKPRTQYLARIRNPHPSLMDLLPEEYDAHGHGGDDIDHGHTEHSPADSHDPGHDEPGDDHATHSPAGDAGGTGPANATAD